jgi:hypothetical protein
MNKQDNISMICSEDSYKYEIDSKVFIITPIYREDSNITIHDALLNLMLKHNINH